MIWLVLSLIVLIGGAEYYSLNKIPGFLSVESRLLTKTTEPGALFILRTTVRNSSCFPLTLLRVTERIPPAATPEDPELTTEAGGARLSWQTWLMPHQQLVKEISFTIQARGCYVFRGSSLFAGDFAGIKGTVRLFERHEEIVVYPPLQDSTEFADTLGGYLGEISVRRFIL